MLPLICGAGPGGLVVHAGLGQRRPEHAASVADPCR
jgi:hypothetical protein